jgi:hypothetical protein
MVQQTRVDVVSQNVAQAPWRKPPYNLGRSGGRSGFGPCYLSPCLKLLTAEEALALCSMLPAKKRMVALYLHNMLLQLTGAVLAKAARFSTCQWPASLVSG